jgi:RNA-directed DNA polymerase
LSEAKPFCISKRELWEAYQSVRANQGAYGVDGESIQEFEADLGNKLYKLWNRMSSGSYFPQPVRRVKIPKADGGTRGLGIPTVTDRIAQTVVLRRLEPELDSCFHPDSYGYRAGKSAIDAVGTARERCWHYGWVLDLDIKGFFDNINHELLMLAVRKHTDEKWVVLYIERWLQAGVEQEDGTVMSQNKGTPQGGVISPLLANLYLHYAVDGWLQRSCSSIPFERFADDVICHCKSERQAQWLMAQIKERLGACGLELHPDKTRIVCCRGVRSGSFDYLGYTFRPRRAKNRSGGYFVSYLPAVSNKALKRMRQTIRRMGLQRRTDLSLEDLANQLNPMLRGWINYYSHFYRSQLNRLVQYVDWVLIRWSKKKYKRLRGRTRKTNHWLRRIRKNQTQLFVHWSLL